jgi:ribonuclease HII
MAGPQLDPPQLVTFAGVDEAGLGPLLGPLCLGYSVFRAPRTRADLWIALADAVSAGVERSEQRFAVADSKRVFSRNARGAKRLEHTALGFLALLDPQRRPLADGDALCWDSPRELSVSRAEINAHPWYAALKTALPRHHERGALELSIERLWRVMQREQVTLLDAGVRVIPERALNASFVRTNNKSLSVWQELAPVLRRLYEQYAADGLRLSVDRQGGRSHYRSLLVELFPTAEVRALREREQLSAYTVTERDGARRMRILFAERGEQHSFAIALGSCLAKYAREICMDAFNASFAAHDPTLRPTAGYTTDGRRWLSDAASAMQAAGVTPEALMRTR